MNFYINFSLAAAYLIASTAFNMFTRVCRAEILILILAQPFLTVGNLMGWVRIPFFKTSLENLTAFFSDPIKIGMI